MNLKKKVSVWNIFKKLFFVEISRAEIQIRRGGATGGIFHPLRMECRLSRSTAPLECGEYKIIPTK